MATKEHILTHLNKIECKPATKASPSPYTCSIYTKDVMAFFMAGAKPVNPPFGKPELIGTFDSVVFTPGIGKKAKNGTITIAAPMAKCSEKKTRTLTVLDCKELDMPLPMY